MAAGRARVLDKAKWHEGKKSVVVPGAFLGWAVKRGLSSDEVEPFDVRDVCAGKLTGEVLLERFDGVLGRELFSTEGQRFADRVYASIRPGTVRAIERALDAELARLKKVAAPSRAPETDARLTRLAARAKKRKVDVEHLLPFVQLGDRSAAGPLRELAETYGWKRKGRGIVPLGAWSDAIACFLEDGPAGVVARVRARKLDGGVALGVLEEVRTSGGVAAVLELADRADKGKHASQRRPAFAALATVIGHEEVKLGAALRASVRALAHRHLTRKLPANEIATAYAILAEVGDASSLEIIDSRPLLRRPWDGSEKSAKRAITKRLRQ